MRKLENLVMKNLIFVQLIKCCDEMEEAYSVKVIKKLN